MFERSILWALAGLSLIYASSGCGRVSPAPAKNTEDLTVVSRAIVLKASEVLPIYSEDLSLGSQSAPVTVVVFLDLECPFCAQAWAAVEQLREKYSPTQLRLVVKHLPLSFHAHAAGAARSVIAVQRRLGDVTAAAYLGHIVRNQAAISDAALATWQSDLSALPDPNKPSSRVFSVSEEEQLARDSTLALGLGIEGTPSFRINGKAFEGALPLSELESAVDEELRITRQLLDHGVLPGELYAERVGTNHRPRQPTPPATEDDTRWAVPVGKSPRLGPPNAPVTIVAFMDYECPFCRRGYLTLKQLVEKYPQHLNVVWKHRPLEFHANARSASEFAHDIYRRVGDAGFWKATEALFEHQDSLSTDTYSAITAQLDPAAARRAGRGSNPERARGAVLDASSEGALIADADLADDFGVDGTPQFFINGLRLRGARSVDDFSAVIDREIAAAAQLSASGVADSAVNAALMKEARPAPEPPKIDGKVVLPDGPTLGSKQAAVTIHVFSDYQCPFCRRADATLRELLAHRPKDVKLVWHDLPLSIHDRARAAATFAREVRAQKGDAAFFEVGRRLFEVQANLSEQVMVDFARELGASEGPLLEALRERAHGGALDRDRKLADDLHITSTPTFVVGRYVLEGAQPIRRFERVIRLQLANSAGANTRAQPR